MYLLLSAACRLLGMEGPEWPRASGACPLYTPDAADEQTARCVGWRTVLHSSLSSLLFLVHFVIVLP